MTNLALNVTASSLTRLEQPDTNFSADASLNLNSGASDANAYLYVEGVPRTGAFIDCLLSIKAITRLAPEQTVTITRLTTSWTQDAVTHNSHPTLGTDPEDILTITGTEVVIDDYLNVDISTLMQLSINADTPFYGVAISIDTGTWSIVSSRNAVPPFVVGSWYPVPTVASSLAPGGNRQVSVPLPRFSWVTPSQAGYRLRLDTSALFDSGYVVDTGWVTSVAQSLEMSTLFSAWAAGTYADGDTVKHIGESWQNRSGGSTAEEPYNAAAAPPWFEITLPALDTTSLAYVEWQFTALAPGDTFHVEQRTVGDDVVWAGASETAPTAGDLTALATSFTTGTEWNYSPNWPGAVVCTHEGAGLYRWTFLASEGWDINSLIPQDPVYIHGDMELESTDAAMVGPYVATFNTPPELQWEDPAFPANTVYGTNVNDEIVFRIDELTGNPSLEGLVFVFNLDSLTADPYPVVAWGGDAPEGLTWIPVGTPQDGFVKVSGEGTDIYISQAQYPLLQYRLTGADEDNLSAADLLGLAALVEDSAPALFSSVTATQPGPTGVVRFTFDDLTSPIGGLDDIWNQYLGIINAVGEEFDITAPTSLGGATTGPYTLADTPASIVAGIEGGAGWPVAASITIEAVDAATGWLWIHVSGTVEPDGDFEAINLTGGTADPTKYAGTGIFSELGVDFNNPIDWEIIVTNLNPYSQTALIYSIDWTDQEDGTPGYGDWFPLLKDGSTLYWQVNVRNGANAEAGYSSEVFGRTSKGTLSLLFPDADVTTSSPRIEWELADRTQASYSVEVQALQDNGAYAPVWRSGWRDGTATVVYPPVGTLFSQDALEYRVAVYTRDTINRVSTFSDPDVYSVSFIVALLDSLSPPTAPTDLDSTLVPPVDILLTWQCDDVPAYWRITRNGEAYGALILGEDAWLGSTDFAYTVDGSTTDDVDWGLMAVAYTGDVSELIEITQGVTFIRGIWLVGLSSSRPAVMIASKNPVRLDHDDDTQLNFGIGVPATATRSAPRGRAGTITGTVERADYPTLYEIYCIGRAAIMFGNITIDSAIIINMKYEATAEGEDPVVIDFQERVAQAPS